MKNALLIVSFMAIAMTARAESAALATTAEAASGSSKPSALILYETATTLAPASAAADSDVQGYSQTGLYRLDVSLPLPEALTATLRAGYSQEYTYVLDDGSSGDFIDTGLGLSRKLGDLSKRLSLWSALNLTLPTSKASRLAGLQSAASASLPFDLKTGRLETSLTLGFTQYFFDRDYRADGTVNPDYAFTASLSPVLSLTRKLSVMASLSFARSFSSFGFPHEKTASSIEVDYQFSKLFGSALGVTTVASTLKNGLQDTYVLYDQSMAAAYLDLSLTL
jgi:hypothetical protein